jgi:hypothetical protein
MPVDPDALTQRIPRSGDRRGPIVLIEVLDPEQAGGYRNELVE